MNTRVKAANKKLKNRSHTEDIRSISMGKLKFNIGDKVINKKESDKDGVIVDYYKKTGEYQVRLKNGETHYVSPRWLDKSN